jgi:hypothetical protein
MSPTWVSQNADVFETSSIIAAIELTVGKMLIKRWRRDYNQVRLYRHKIIQIIYADLPNKYNRMN